MGRRMADFAKLIAAALFTAVLFPPFALAQRTASTPYDAESLHPDVRRVVLRARENAARAETAAIAAREEAMRAEAAAERARNGEPNHRAYDFPHDSQQRRYEGEWVEGERANGLGVLTFGAGEYQGDRYSGGFRNGRKFGLGVYIHAINPGQEIHARYEGDYVAGEAERYGVFYGASGIRHAGRSGGDAFNGAAVYDFPNGRRYEGDFTNNRPHGLGVLWDARGRVRQVGRWIDGRFSTRMRPND